MCLGIYRTYENHVSKLAMNIQNNEKQHPQLSSKYYIISYFFLPVLSIYASTLISYNTPFSFSFSDPSLPSANVSNTSSSESHIFPLSSLSLPSSSSFDIFPLSLLSLLTPPPPFPYHRCLYHFIHYTLPASPV